MEEKRIVEINGVKLEVDLTTAKRVDTFKRGDNVRVLKKTYGDNYEILSGVITDFVLFKELPTMMIAVYNPASYGSAPNISFIYYNSKTLSDAIEIVPCSESELLVSKNTVMQQFDNAIEAKHKEYLDLVAKKEFFVNNFGLGDKVREEV